MSALWWKITKQRDNTPLTPAQHAFAISILIALAILAFVPLAFLIWQALSGISSKRLLDLYHLPGVYNSLRNSVLLSLVVAGATTVVGSLLGILFAKTTLKGAYLFLSLLLLPLLLPAYIIALGWVAIIGVNHFLSPYLFGFAGVAWTLFTVYLPLPVILCLFFAKQVAPNQENAARLYAGNWQVLQKITLPLMKPALILSFLLVFILSFAEYSVANVLRYSVFPLQGFTYFSAFYDFQAAVILSLPMFLVALVVLWIARQYVGSRSITFKTCRQINMFRLSPHQQILLQIVLSVLVFFMVMLPLSSLFLRIGDVDTIAQGLSLAAMPWLRSVLYSLAAASLITILGFCCAYIIVNQWIRYRRLLDFGILFVFILPASVLAISLILFWNHAWLNAVYASAMIVILGYSGKYLAIASKTLEHRLLQIPPNQLQAAQLAGANRAQIIHHIVLPELKNILLAVFGVGFVFCYRESTLTMLLYPPGYETLPVYTITQMANGKPAMIAALCMIMAVSIILPFLCLSWYYQYKTIKKIV